MPDPVWERLGTMLIVKRLAVVAAFAIVAGCGSSSKPLVVASPAPAAVTPSTSCVDFGTCETDTPEPSPTENLFDLAPGTVVELTTDDSGYSVVVNTVVNRLPGEFDEPAGAGLHYISANVTYVCIKGTCSYNPLDWKARQPDGTSTDYEYLSSGGLDSGDLAAGNRVRGNVYFKVPVNSHGTVVYSTGLGSEQASWRY